MKSLQARFRVLGFAIMSKKLHRVWASALPRNIGLSVFWISTENFEAVGSGFRVKAQRGPHLCIPFLKKEDQRHKKMRYTGCTNPSSHERHNFLKWYLV